jgi:cysteinyl-tRNA synthetase
MACASTSDGTVQQRSNKELWLHNTMSGKKEMFQPRPDQGNKVSMYCCGVTVYDYSHVGGYLPSLPVSHPRCKLHSQFATHLTPKEDVPAGHARVYCAFDVLFRYLRHLGYEVDYVRNFTDIDDKIIKRASETGENPLELSQRCGILQILCT